MIVVRLFGTHGAMRAWLVKILPGPSCKVRWANHSVTVSREGQGFTIMGFLVTDNPLERIRGLQPVFLEVDPSVGYSTEIVAMIETIKETLR